MESGEKQGNAVIRGGMSREGFEREQVDVSHSLMMVQHFNLAGNTHTHIQYVQYHTFFSFLSCHSFL